MEEDFSRAVQILLTVVNNQSNSRLTSHAELISREDYRASSMVSVIDKLIFAEILTANGPAYRLARSPSAIKLHEIYAATLSVSELPKTRFGRFHETIVEEAKDAIATEYGGLDLNDTLAHLMSTASSWPKHDSNR